MEDFSIPFEYNGARHKFEFAFIAGTPVDNPFWFGNEQAILISDFYMAKTETTQALWIFIMGNDLNNSQYKNDLNPVEHVSWNEICQPGGFLEKLNDKFKTYGRFRLPTETEWEYAARGGQRWHDGFRFAGTNDIAEVGWYESNAGPYNDPVIISRLKNRDKLTQAQPVAQKKPNQLGLYDMNGNIWEWCEDWFIRDTNLLPKDGSAYALPTNSKVLRGGCHHNGAVHCTNVMRYEIPPDSFDGCIGFRVAFDKKKE